MKSLFALASSLLLCSCADMYVARSQVGGGSVASVDGKDFGSVRMVSTNCGVGDYSPRAIYIRPFCVDSAVFAGDVALSSGEVPIRRALTPVEFAQDLKEQMEKIAPARILRPNESAPTGWLVTGRFQMVNGGNPSGRFAFGQAGVGQSTLVLHVHITSAHTGAVVYDFDLAGGSDLQGKLGTVRASGLGRATHFDLQNAAERVYLTLSANPYRYAARANVSLPE